MKNLVIVESPAKEKTIEKYLGKDYKVMSSKGHIRDLATSGKYGLGIDVENDFVPKYIISKDKKKVVKELETALKSASKVFLATDPDREGEAISWHLKECLNIDDNQYTRVVFNEITKDVILREIKNGRKIDDGLVRSQETRRMLDRIIGFRLSKLMQKKTDGSSAGRVQSVALKLIVDKEEEISKFIIEEYYEIDAYFKDFTAQLFAYNNKDISINSEAMANEILSKLSSSFKIQSVTKKNVKRNAKPAFTTSTLTQAASSKYNWPAKKTMMVAQKMYEGIELDNETVGLITYMRTDSTRLSEEFIKNTYSFIDDKYGKNYIGIYKEKKKKENVQDAHEAIRPTSIRKRPEDIKKYLTLDEYKLYTLIYTRALASLMKEASFESTTIILDNNNYQFKATGSILVFDGYLKVYQEFDDNENKLLPDLENYKTNVVVAHEIEKSVHYTKPPARYTEASLIKELEELGIGRPSTYAKIIDTLKTRDYVEINEKKFFPTKVGTDITIKLQEVFSDIINVKYTAKMEEELDEISTGNYDSLKLMKDFYNEFEPLVEKALETMEKIEDEKVGELCPECNHDLVYKQGKYGKFIACSNYPNCKYIKSENKVVIKCPNCDGNIIERKTKTKKIFYGCDNFPTCKTAYWDKPTEEKCSTCGNMLFLNKYGKVKCNECNPKPEKNDKVVKKSSTKKTKKKTSK